MNVVFGVSSGPTVGAVYGREVRAMSTPSVPPDWQTMVPPELPLSDDDAPPPGSTESCNCDSRTTSPAGVPADTAPAATGDTVILRPISSLREHPDSGIVPAMSDDEYQSLKKNIRLHGMREPLAVLDGGEVLDGRHRFRVARELGLGEVRCRTVALPPNTTAAEWMVTAAIERRHLTPGQRAALAVELESYLKAREGAAARQAATRVREGKAPKSATPSVVASLPAPGGRRSRDVAAKLAGVSGRVIQDTLKMKAEAPDLFAGLKSARLTTNKAMGEMRKRRGAEAAGAATSGLGKKQSEGRPTQTSGKGTAARIRKADIETAFTDLDHALAAATLAAKRIREMSRAVPFDRRKRLKRHVLKAGRDLICLAELL